MLCCSEINLYIGIKNPKFKIVAMNEIICPYLLELKISINKLKKIGQITSDIR